MKHKLIIFLAILVSVYSLSVTSSGCAQIGMPTGGTKDSLAPVLVSATPDERSTNTDAKKIYLTFDEYVEIAEAQRNVLVTPVQKNSPEVRWNLKTVTVRLKDSLLPNTTYAINFGNSIKDVNEGNIYKDYTYVFSTGSTIDSVELSGRVMMAETGKTDSLVMVSLYRNATDSSVTKSRPDYQARVKADGRFTFKYLPGGSFRLYALKDGDGSKSYNSKSELFGFLDKDDPLTLPYTYADSLVLYAYEQEKTKDPGTKTGPAPKPKLEKKLRYLGQPATQDLLTPLVLTFNNPVKVDEQKIYITDTNYHRIPGVKISLDSTNTMVTLANNWEPEANYVLFVEKDAAKDSLENELAKSDTIHFKTKRNEDYGKILIRFTNLDLAGHPVIQFLEGDNVKYAYPIKGQQWNNDLFPPGEYGIRILFDTNNNGVWDPGDFSKKLQPETAILLPQKLAIKANWENEREIRF